MEQLFENKSGSPKQLYCCLHGDNLYVKYSAEDTFYPIKFEKCNRSNRGWYYLHLLDYREGLIGTKKIFKLVVKDAAKEDSAPFLIIAEKLTRGHFEPKEPETGNDERRK